MTLRHVGRWSRWRGVVALFIVALLGLQVLPIAPAPAGPSALPDGYRFEPINVCDPDGTILTQLADIPLLPPGAVEATVLLAARAAPAPTPVFLPEGSAREIDYPPRRFS
jgi:hypothetical protein